MVAAHPWRYTNGQPAFDRDRLLHGLVEANEKTRRLPQPHTVPSVDNSVELAEVEVCTPTGVQLVEPLNLRLDPGASMVIVGRSGCGKTTLLRSLAQLWPFTSGTLRRPGGDVETMFLSQLPYVPLGNMRAVLSYPAAAGDIPDHRLNAGLTKVAVAHLHGRLDEVQDWANVFSPGEQLRVAFARILLSKPRAVFLDEATSALDAGLEYSLYQLVRTELPDTVVESPIATPWSHITSSSWRYSVTAPGASGRSASNPRPPCPAARAASPG